LADAVLLAERHDAQSEIAHARGRSDQVGIRPLHATEIEGAADQQAHGRQA
jgi:hypothetical protein